MKFTSEDLMKAMGLQVGDRIKVTFKDDTIEEYEIIKYDNGNIILHDDFHGYDDHVGYLLDNEIEILPKPKRVGDLKCDDIPHSDCTICPIKILCLDYGDNNNQSFYEILKDYKSKAGEHFDQEIHDLLKARLDKEVE